tara:strand:- start:145 stop:903 length:759 start_codon:yes stop_codon:yes gene_type:complete
MSKIEQAAKEFLKTKRIRNKQLLVTLPSREREYFQMNKLLEDFATSQPFNLDVKVDDDWEFAPKPTTPEEPYRSDTDCDVYIQWKIYLEKWRKLPTARQKIAELERENKTLLGKKERVISIRARLGKANQQIEQLTDKLERRDKHIMILEELRDVLTQERDELKEYRDAISEKGRVEWEKLHIAQCNQCGFPQGNQEFQKLEQQLSAEKQKNEELSKNFGMFLDRIGDALEDNQSFGYLSIEADEIQQLLNK